MRLELYFRPNGSDRHLQTVRPTAPEGAFFSSTYGMFSKINHMLGHKYLLND